MEGLASMRPGKTGKGMDKGAMKAAKIVSMLFADRTWAHVAHLKTSSFSQHKALNEFYDEVVDIADTFAETAQGKFGKLDIPVGAVATEYLMPADHLEDSIKAIRDEAEGCDNRALMNIVDEIEGLYLSTIYKIRELH